MKPFDLLALNWILWGIWTLVFASPELQAANFGTLPGQAFIAILGGSFYFLHRIYG